MLIRLVMTQITCKSRICVFASEQPKIKQIMPVYLKLKAVSYFSLSSLLPKCVSLLTQHLFSISSRDNFLQMCWKYGLPSLHSLLCYCFFNEGIRNFLRDFHSSDLQHSCISLGLSISFYLPFLMKFIQEKISVVVAKFHCCWRWLWISQY